MVGSRASSLQLLTSPSTDVDRSFCTSIHFCGICSVVSERALIAVCTALLAVVARFARLQHRRRRHLQPRRARRSPCRARRSIRRRRTSRSPHARRHNRAPCPSLRRFARSAPHACCVSFAYGAMSFACCSICRRARSSRTESTLRATPASCRCRSSSRRARPSRRRDPRSRPSKSSSNSSTPA